MKNENAFELNPVEALDIAARHKKKLVLCPLVVIAAGLLVILFYPRTYRSQAKLFLQIGRESLGVDPTATIGQTISLSQNGRRDEVQSALEVLRSRAIIGAAVDKVGPAAVLRAGGADQKTGSQISDALVAIPNRLIGWIQSFDPITDRERAILRAEVSLDIDAERDSAVIAIDYHAKSPQQAQQICSAIVDVYQREHLRIHRNPESNTFFDDQRALLRDKLEDAKQRLRRAKDELGLASIDGRSDTLEAQFSEVTRHRYEAEQQLSSAKARIEDLERQLNELPARMTASKTSIPNQGADLLREKYYALQLKEMGLKARYSDEHPLVQAVSKQAAEAKKVIDGVERTRYETTDDVNPVHRELLLELKKQHNLLAGLEANLKRLEQQEEQIRTDLRSINESEMLITQLEQEAQLARDTYEKYSQYLEATRMDRELQREQISNLSVVQQPTLQEKPVRPSKALVALATLFLATFGTAGLVLSSEYFQRCRLDAEYGERYVTATIVPPNSARERQLARNGANN